MTDKPSAEPVAWIADIKPYADHRQTRCIVFDKSDLSYIEDGKTVWSPLYLRPVPDPEVVRLLEEARGVISLYVHIGAAHPDVKHLVERIDAKLAELKK